MPFFVYLFRGRSASARSLTGCVETPTEWEALLVRPPRGCIKRVHRRPVQRWELLGGNLKVGDMFNKGGHLSGRITVSPISDAGAANSASYRTSLYCR